MSPSTSQVQTQKPKARSEAIELITDTDWPPTRRSETSEHPIHAISFALGCAVVHVSAAASEAQKTVMCETCIF
jgi:hypothetical protein